ncbi:MAG: hypothetical protein R2762_11770 [Bryobacteraceae bacterium]
MGGKGGRKNKGGQESHAWICEIEAKIGKEIIFSVSEREFAFDFYGLAGVHCYCRGVRDCDAVGGPETGWRAIAALSNRLWRWAAKALRWG